MELPEEGLSREAVAERLRAAQEEDIDWRERPPWYLTYHAGEDVEAVMNEAHAAFAETNALSPSAFPSLRRFENEVVGMTAGLLDCGDVVGNVTSGGTESILLSVLSARERARDRGVETPTVVLPRTGHPAFEKAAHYFGVETVRTAVRGDWRADVDALAAAIDDRTALVVGSAPSYPHGVVDPIPEVASVAADRGVPCHVDACIGGFVLAGMRRAGRDVPAFDLSIPGVTSLSVDPHKYGYTAKGVSVLLYDDPGLRRRQFFADDSWPGGVYAGPTMGGTRPGGPIAAAWAVMQYLGAAGYVRLAERVRSTTERLCDAIEDTDGIGVVSDPDASLLAFESRDPEVDAYAVGEALEGRGWHPGRNREPRSVHLSVMQAHADLIEEFVADLRDAVEGTRGETVESSAAYGAGGDRIEAAVDRLDGTYRPE